MARLRDRWLRDRWLLVLLVMLAALAAPAAAQDAPQSPTLSTGDRLDDRRYVETGTRGYVVGPLLHRVLLTDAQATEGYIAGDPYTRP